MAKVNTRRAKRDFQESLINSKWLNPPSEYGVRDFLQEFLFIDKEMLDDDYWLFILSGGDEYGPAVSEMVLLDEKKSFRRSDLDNGRE